MDSNSNPNLDKEVVNPGPVPPIAPQPEESHTNIGEEVRTPPPYPGAPFFPIPQHQYAYQNAGFVYTPPPDGYFGGNMNDTVSASQAVNAAIHQNGRTSVSVVCPNCRTLTLTETKEIPNSTMLQGQAKSVYVFFAGTIVFIIAFFVVVTFISDTYIPLGVMPVFLLLLFLGFFMSRISRRNAAKAFCDIQHNCRHCGTVLGVNSGTQFYQQTYAGRFWNGRRQL